MIIEGFDCHRYTVPFKAPFTISHEFQQQREGLLLRLTTDNGIIGYGEAVALPSFGTAELDELEKRLRDLGDQVIGKTTDDLSSLLDRLSNDRTIAPVRFALDTALLDIRSDEADVPMAQYLKPDAASSVPLNVTISDTNPQGAATAAGYAVTAGYTAIKMKVGVISDPAIETERVAAVREAAGPETELRLDANGGWSIEQAIEMARAVEPFDIAYLEQPLPPNDTGAMAQLRQQIDIPLAADEAATDRQAIEELIEIEAADVIIIKPGIVGGMAAARELVDLVHDEGLRVVVTTSIETGIAITAALHLAATLPEPTPACGLATGALLETDLLTESPQIHGGRMFVPEAPGLGVDPMRSLWDG